MNLLTPKRGRKQGRCYLLPQFWLGEGCSAGQLREPGICSSHWEVGRTRAWFMHDAAKPPGMAAWYGWDWPVLPVWQAKGYMNECFLSNT